MGQIVIDESMTDWIYGGKPNTFIVFMYLLRKSDENGVVQVSVERISKDVKLTHQQVKSAIKELINNQQITNKITNNAKRKGTIFSIVYRNRYFQNNQQNNQQITNKQPIKSANKQTKKPLQKKPTKPIEPVVYYPNDEKLNKTFLEYIENRKQMGKPMTELAITKAMNNLAKLSSVNGVMDNDKAIAILDQSIIGGWQGLFPLKDNYKPREGKGRIDWDSI